MSPDSDRPQRSRAETVAERLYGLHLWTVFGLALSNGFLALAGCFSPWAARARRIPWDRLRPILLPLGLYAVLVVISILTSYDRRISMRQGTGLLSLGTLVLALILIRGEAPVRKIVDGLVIVAALASLYGLGQILVGYGDLNHRIRGPFSHYMTFAGVLLVVDVMLLAQFFCGRVKKSAWRWAALVVINLALIGCLTRSAWVALLLTLTVLVLLRAPRLLIAYVPVALLFLLLAPTTVIHRVRSIVDLSDISNYDRLCMAEAGLYMIRERPFLGLGPGMVKERYPIYRHPSAPRQWVTHLHNSYLQIAAEEGLLALGAYLWLMLVSLRSALRGFKRHESSGGDAADLYLGVCLALLAFNLAGLFEDNWGDTEVQRLILFVAAIPYCLLDGEQQRSQISADSAPREG